MRSAAINFKVEEDEASNCLRFLLCGVHILTRTVPLSIFGYKENFFFFFLSFFFFLLYQGIFLELKRL